MAFVLVCSGECDFVSLDQLRRELQLLKTEPDPVLDLTGLRYIDSRAIAEIVNLHREREALGLPRERIIVKPSSLVH